MHAALERHSYVQWKTHEFACALGARSCLSPWRRILQYKGHDSFQDPVSSGVVQLLRVWNSESNHPLLHQFFLHSGCLFIQHSQDRAKLLAIPDPAKVRERRIQQSISNRALTPENVDSPERRQRLWFTRPGDQDVRIRRSGHPAEASEQAARIISCAQLQNSDGTVLLHQRQR